MPPEEPNDDEKPKFEEGMRAKRVSTFFNKNNEKRGVHQGQIEDTDLPQPMDNNLFRGGENQANENVLIMQDHNLDDDQEAEAIQFEEEEKEVNPPRNLFTSFHPQIQDDQDFNDSSSSSFQGFQIDQSQYAAIVVQQIDE